MYSSLNDNLFNDAMSLTLNENTRIGFARKVFFIVASQLLVTILFVIMVMYTPAILEFQKSSASIWT